MTGKRIRLVLAATAFFGWILWLAIAVRGNGKVPVVSRAQLTAASCLVVADVTITDQNLVAPRVTVSSVVSGPGVNAGDVVTVVNLPKAIAAGTYAVPVAGPHLIPLAKTPDGFWKVAGLPPSPGYNLADPDRPLIYPWNDDVKRQLRRLGIEVP
jgi:hypothetical protein